MMGIHIFIRDMRYVYASFYYKYRERETAIDNSIPDDEYVQCTPQYIRLQLY